MPRDEEDGFFGLFGFTGKKTTGMFDGVLDMEGGYIKTDECMRTNIPGVVCRRRRAGDPPASGGDSLRRRRHRRHAVLQVYQRSEVILKGVHYYAGSDQGKFRSGSPQGRG